VFQHELSFNNVAGFGNNVDGNNVERNFVLSTVSKQIEHVQFFSTLSKGRNFIIESFDIVAACCNKVECCFDKVERCFDNVACCFEIVAGVDGALAVVAIVPCRVNLSAELRMRPRSQTILS